MSTILWNMATVVEQCVGSQASGDTLKMTVKGDSSNRNFSNCLCHLPPYKVLLTISSLTPNSAWDLHCTWSFRLRWMSFHPYPVFCFVTAVLVLSDNMHTNTCIRVTSSFLFCQWHKRCFKMLFHFFGQQAFSPSLKQTLFF